jgi:hypothetical protein
MNRERIGFDRFIRLAWLDQAALLAHELRDPAVSPSSRSGRGGTNRAEALRAALLDHLADEVAGERARRNTVNVLTRIWWRVPESHIPLRDEALAQVAGLAPEERLTLHWGMALLAYPLLQDTVTIIGRLLRLQGTFKVAQLSRRIGAEWGNRTTLEYAVPRIVRSLADWGVLQATDELGCYRAGAPIAPSNPEPALWLLEAVLRIRCTDVPLSDLLRTPELFPFTIPLSSGELLRSERFQFHQQGQDMLMIQPAGEP